MNKELYLKEFKRLYDEGLNDSEIAKELEISLTTVNKWRRDANLSKNFKYKRSFDIEKFEELYNKGFNYSQIAKELGVSSSAIQEYASSHNFNSNYNVYEKLELSDEEFQVLLGTMYGDGYLTIQNKNARGHFAHSLAQQNYCLWKYEKLKRFCSEPKINSQFDKRTNKTYKSIRVVIKSHPIFTEIYHKLYNNKIKYINKELFSKINALGLAVWFMDDGYKHGCSYSIATNCFSKEDLEIIIDVLEQKFNLHFTILNSSNVIYLHAKDKNKFKDIILPYIHDDCLYKLHTGAPKTPLNGVNPEMDVPVLNPQEIEENA